MKATPPRNVGDIRRLMGLLNCYRRYIPNFSKTVKPIYDLIKGDGDGTSKHSKSKGQLPSSALVKWTDVHQLILDDPPVMAYPDFNKPFILCTDASVEGWEQCCTNVKITKPKLSRMPPEV